MTESYKEVITVSTGVKFGIRDVPIIAFRDLQRRYEKERPHVPVMYIEDKDREEENPNDPDYQEALEKWNEETEMKLMDFILMTGTRVAAIPDNIQSVESEGWAEECRYLGNEVAKDGGVRYIQWLKYVACPSANDYTRLLMGAGRTIGVTEADVADAAATFQNREERRANPKPRGKARSK